MRMNGTILMSRGKNSWVRFSEQGWVNSAERIALLKGLVRCTACGSDMSPATTSKGELGLTAQFEENKVEPNSGLGEAIAYMRKHWNELTLFLRAPGAPLDNNICERILKKAILHRKNAYFFKTLNGARVGDLFMSLIPACCADAQRGQAHLRT